MTAGDAGAAAVERAAEVIEAQLKFRLADALEWDWEPDVGVPSVAEVLVPVIADLTPHLVTALAAANLLAAPVPTEPCGARAHGGRCTMPAGHNQGQADVPENHGALATRAAPVPTGTAHEALARGRKEGRDEVYSLTRRMLADRGFATDGVTLGSDLANALDVPTGTAQVEHLTDADPMTPEGRDMFRRAGVEPTGMAHEKPLREAVLSDLFALAVEDSFVPPGWSSHVVSINRLAEIVASLARHDTGSGQ